MTNDGDRPQGSSLPKETEELLRAYFDAFPNLYGIIPLYRALRIIQKQNPELGLTEEEFLAFTEVLRQEEHFYIIAGEEDIYIDVETPTPPLKREVIAEYLYAVDDFESYEELKDKQEDKPFYIPEKEEILKYKDEYYFEETKEYQALSSLLKDEIKMNRADDVLSDLICNARLEYVDTDKIMWTVERLAGRDAFHSTEEIKKFFRCYANMYNHLRLMSNRGYTPAEMRERIGGPLLTFRMVDADREKPGRNDPCPCGSGKKYKHCCGR